MPFNSTYLYFYWISFFQQVVVIEGLACLKTGEWVARRAENVSCLLEKNGLPVIMVYTASCDSYDQGTLKVQKTQVTTKLLSQRKAALTHIFSMINIS